MPQQKQFQADPSNPADLEGLFGLGQALVMDGWGATVTANPQVAVLTTNAPMNIIQFHLTKQFV